MTENVTPPVPEIEARLHEVARLLRESSSLDPDSRGVLAELIDELGQALRSSQPAPAEVAQLAGTTAQLAEALHRRHDSSWLAQVRDRFEEAAARAEVRAPVAVGLARRLLDALANIGI
jgi:hypothetical protein